MAKRRGRPRKKEEIPAETRHEIQKLVYRGWSQQDLRRQFPEISETSMANMVHQFKREFRDEKMQIGRENLESLVAANSQVMQGLFEDFERLGKPATETRIVINDDGKESVTITKSMKDRSAVAGKLVQTIELAARMLGIFSPDFDAQGGQQLGIVDVPVANEDEIERFEKLGRTGSFEKIESQIIEATSE